MKTLTSLLAVCALSAPAMSQALNEDFSYSVTGVFPPAGWVNNNLNAGTYPGWEEVTIQTYSTQAQNLTADAAVHDDMLSGQTNDYRLESTTMDLSSYPAAELTFDSELYYAAFTSAGGSGDGESYVEVSTDGGATWTAVWNETSPTNYFSNLTVDLSSVGGNAAVELGFRYFGTYAHGWVIDNAVVDNGVPPGPALAITGSCPGTMTASASNMTPGGPVVFLFGNSGSFTAAGGPCAGTTVPLNSPVHVGSVAADGSGNASASGNVPSVACGTKWVVAVDGASCGVSNAVGL